MKKIGMLVIIFVIYISSIYAAENIVVNVNTEVGCNVQITISNSAITEDIISRINGIYQGFNISGVKFNSVSLASSKTLEEQGIRNGSVLNLESSVAHRYIDLGVTKLPTCTENGEKTVRCSTCSNSKISPVDKLGHALDNVETTKPTCIKDGVEVMSCIRCTHTERKNITKTGHTYGVWEVTKEPTCQETGEMNRKCVKCTKVETTIAEKIKHDIIEEKIDPTCTKVGYIIHKCSYNCGYIENKTQIFELGHNMTEWTTDTEPTLVENGEKIRRCKNVDCDYVETDKISSLATGGNQTEVIDGIVQELKKDENRGKLFVIIGIILLPIVYVVIRDIYLAEVNQINKKKKANKKSKKEEKTDKEKTDKEKTDKEKTDKKVKKEN